MKICTVVTPRQNFLREGLILSFVLIDMIYLSSRMVTSLIWALALDLVPAGPLHGLKIDLALHFELGAISK